MCLFLKDNPAWNGLRNDKVLLLTCAVCRMGMDQIRARAETVLVGVRGRRYAVGCTTETRPFVQES